MKRLASTLLALTILAPAALNAQGTATAATSQNAEAGNLAVVATATSSGRANYSVTTLNDELTPTPPGNSILLGFFFKEKLSTTGPTAGKPLQTTISVK